MSQKLKLYFIGVGWFLLSLVSSSVNDVISKYVAIRLPSYEITFFRFFFAAITLLPFIFTNGPKSVKSEYLFIHLIRGLLLFLGSVAWTRGLSIAPVTTATIVSFMIPVFILIIGVFFLDERIIWQRWVVTLIAFFGLVVTLRPNSDHFNPEILIFLFAAICFALLDVINKKFVIRESMFSMLFYSATVTAILTMPFALNYWLAPNLSELLLLFSLGASANLILFFLLKGFALVDATALAPYRYFELIISAIIAFLIFQELPGTATILGAIIIIPSTLFIIYSEQKNTDKETKSS